MIELDRSAQEKRARRVVTRPKPTIYGNCDSWSFIVGKKARQYSAEIGSLVLLQRGNMDFTHSLSTILVGSLWDNLWVICGSPVDGLKSSRMVNSGRIHMPKITFSRPRFYRDL
ncbi:hypothetical protein [Variovorax terrae]|uniref:Uncharacterized protein n=1 Tax=Variovorax terrae TaxID=2923278 RepID=A0A9X1VYE5_9BURK|nr:hypothetical protein [Variovorax terrae]MCJ0764297.1 hypothetical protein [Variovorax terrae]